eukprot:NODE_3014_length_426_cov_165.901857_g2402_i0.p3 GENE.NODE_3014_length_426_cov_165.901857_g2402_i0~~NODE_3014_length_426_cov_165.901857_g2402_i0.p3  ORF type:complete len:81 (-),score=22.74 NODE_3014_length_426_cov_165.901857_g2402_i0:97-339(-)
MSEMTFNIVGMTCKSCVGLIQDVVGGMDGVESIVVDLAAKSAKLALKSDAPADVKQKVSDQIGECGFTCDITGTMSTKQE